MEKRAKLVSDIKNANDLATLEKFYKEVKTLNEKIYESSDFDTQVKALEALILGFPEIDYQILLEEKQKLNDKIKKARSKEYLPELNEVNSLKAKFLAQLKLKTDKAALLKKFENLEAEIIKANQDGLLLNGNYEKSDCVSVAGTDIGGDYEYLIARVILYKRWVVDLHYSNNSNDDLNCFIGYLNSEKDNFERAKLKARLSKRVVEIKSKITQLENSSTQYNFNQRLDIISKSFEPLSRVHSNLSTISSDLEALDLEIIAQLTQEERRKTKEEKRRKEEEEREKNEIRRSLLSSIIDLDDIKSSCSNPKLLTIKDGLISDIKKAEILDEKTYQELNDRIKKLRLDVESEKIEKEKQNLIHKIISDFDISNYRITDDNYLLDYYAIENEIRNSIMVEKSALINKIKNANVLDPIIFKSLENEIDQFNTEEIKIIIKDKIAQEEKRKEEAEKRKQTMEERVRGIKAEISEIPKEVITAFEHLDSSEIHSSTFLSMHFYENIFFKGSLIKVAQARSTLKSRIFDYENDDIESQIKKFEKEVSDFNIEIEQKIKIAQEHIEKCNECQK